jgi:hypothetical protein
MTTDYRLKNKDHRTKTKDYRLQTLSACLSVCIRIAGVQNKIGAKSILSPLPPPPIPLEQKWLETGLYCKHPPPLLPHAHLLQTTDYRPQTIDYKPQTTDYRLQTKDHRLKTTDQKPQTTDDHRLQTKDHRPKTTVYRLQTKD